MNLNELPVMRRLGTESFLTEGLPHIAVDREDFEAFKEALGLAVGVLITISGCHDSPHNDGEAMEALAEIKKILGGDDVYKPTHFESIEPKIDTNYK